MNWQEVADHYGLIISCRSAIGCKQGWSVRAHYLGRADQFGYLHWSRVTIRPDNLYVFLKPVWRALHHIPLWHRLNWWSTWEQASWASNEMLHQWHRRPPEHIVAHDRQRVSDLVRRAKVPTRHHHRALYSFMYRRLK